MGAVRRPPARRGFDGRPVDPTTSIRQDIVADLLAHGPSSAWAVAKRINALGSSVSSLMYKMWVDGALQDTLTLTPRGARTYKVRQP